ncbi:MAG: hypothetical protein PHS14_05375 [Elusimicrobia bacterium]|nr:hypothetical protein [Elusimicrobiota bacterium]
MKPILIALLAAAACSRPAPNAPAEYRPADDSFSATLPGGWKVDDSPAETRKAAFFGPPAGPGAFTEMIRVSLYPATTPEAYRAKQSGLPTPLRETAAGGAKAWEFLIDSEFRDPHAGVKKLSSRVVALPTPRGLFVLEHTWPAGEPSGREAFEELLRTFKPAASGS